MKSLSITETFPQISPSLLTITQDALLGKAEPKYTGVMDRRLHVSLLSQGLSPPRVCTWFLLAFSLPLSCLYLGHRCVIDESLCFKLLCHSYLPIALVPEQSTPYWPDEALDKSQITT